MESAGLRKNISRPLADRVRDDTDLFVGCHRGLLADNPALSGHDEALCVDHGWLVFG